MSRRPLNLPEVLPNGINAVVTRDKLMHYLLDDGHAAGGAHKARLWQSVAGYDRSNAERLRDALAAGARHARVTGWKLNADGSASWQTELAIPHGSEPRMVEVQARWRTLTVGNAPRLTSAWPVPDL